MSAAEIARALNGRHEGRRWRCQCPVCGRGNLTVCDMRGGRHLVKCWNGCEYKEIFIALFAQGLLQGDEDRKQHIHDNHGLDDIDLVREYPGGPPLALESNAIALIRAHPQMRGVFALDEFRQQTGIPVFPVNSDKSPACARGFHAATSETNQVRRLFLQAPRAHRIAMPTGELTHIAVIDVDPAGQQWMYAQDAKGRWPATRIHSMPRGGRHLFFLHSPGLRSSTSKLAPGVDIRAQGGCITIRGPGYEVVGGAPVASFPRSILRDLARLERATEKRREKLLRSLSGGAGSEERLLGWVRASRRGERNQRLFWASCKAAAAGSDCRAFVAAGMAIGLPAIGAGSEERLLGCRRPYQHLEQSTAGYDQTGWLMQVGGCCTALLKSIIAVSIYFAPAPPLRPWVEDDRLWFEAHPQRTHRLRPAHPNEGAEPPDCWIVVRRLEAGARQRLAVAMTDQFNELFSGLDATEEIWEATARAIFDTLVHARESGKDKVSPQELGVYVNFLAAETRA